MQTKKVGGEKRRGATFEELCIYHHGATASND